MASAVHGTSSTGAPTGGAIKKFTYAQIKDRVEKRKHVREYLDLLMECKVHEDETGVYFNSQHPSWTKLVELVKIRDQELAEAEARKKAAAAAAPVAGVNQAEGVIGSQATETKEMLSPGSTPSSTSSTSSAANPTAAATILSPLDPPPAALRPREVTNSSGAPQTPNPSMQDEIMTRLLDELKQPNPSAATVLKLCRTVGIPQCARPAVWSLLLGVSPSAKAAPLPVPVRNQDGGSEKPRYEIPDVEASYHDLDGRDLLNRRVLKVDIMRTLPNAPFFQHPRVQALMEYVLVWYCTTHNVSYKQGMNYILAPILIARLLAHVSPIREFSYPEDITKSAKTVPYPRGPVFNPSATVEGAGTQRTIFDEATDEETGFTTVPEPVAWLLQSRDEICESFAALVGRLLPNTYTDSQFGPLQCQLASFRFLLQYHDPELSTYLDKSDMSPELYASSWFLTLHVNRTKDLSVVLTFFDALLLELGADPLLHYFISLALMLSHRDALLGEPAITLPEKLTRLSITSTGQVRDLVQEAFGLRERTPVSFLLQLHALTTRTIPVDSVEYQHLLRCATLTVSPHEVHAKIYQQLTTDASRASDSRDGSGLTIRYVVIDCRPLKQYQSGHLPSSIYIDPRNIEAQGLGNSSALAADLNQLTALRGLHHFCLLPEGAGPAKEAGAAALVAYMLERGIKYVSIIQGGYEAFHEIAYPLGLSSPSKPQGTSAALAAGIPASLVGVARYEASGSHVELIDHVPSQCKVCVEYRQKKQANKARRVKQVAEISSTDGVEEFGTGSDQRSAEKGAHILSSSLMGMPTAAAAAATAEVGTNKPTTVEASSTVSVGRNFVGGILQKGKKGLMKLGILGKSNNDANDEYSPLVATSSSQEAESLSLDVGSDEAPSKLGSPISDTPQSSFTLMESPISGSLLLRLYVTPLRDVSANGPTLRSAAVYLVTALFEKLLEVPKLSNDPSSSMGGSGGQSRGPFYQALKVTPIKASEGRFVSCCSMTTKITLLALHDAWDADTVTCPHPEGNEPTLITPVDACLDLVTRVSQHLLGAVQCTSAVMSMGPEDLIKQQAEWWERIASVDSTPNLEGKSSIEHPPTEPPTSPERLERKKSTLIARTRISTGAEELQSSKVVLFVPMLDPDAPIDVSDAVFYLQHVMGVPLSNISILTFAAIRPLLWVLDKSCPGVPVVSLSIDAIEPTLPGPPCPNRYNPMHRPHFAASSPSSAHHPETPPQVESPTSQGKHRHRVSPGVTDFWYRYMQQPHAHPAILRK